MGNPRNPVNPSPGSPLPRQSVGGSSAPRTAGGSGGAG